MSNDITVISSDEENFDDLNIDYMLFTYNHLGYYSDEESIDNKESKDNIDNIFFIQQEAVPVAPHLYRFANEAEKAFHSYIEKHHTNHIVPVLRA